MFPSSEKMAIPGTIPKIVAFIKSRQHTPEAAAAKLIAVKGRIVRIWSINTRG
jgi:hypothetical protein